MRAAPHGQRASLGQVTLLDLLTLLASGAAIGGAVAAGRVAAVNAAGMVLVVVLGLVLGIGSTMAMSMLVRRLRRLTTKPAGATVVLVYLLASVWVGVAGWLGMVTALGVLRLLHFPDLALTRK